MVKHEASVHPVWQFYFEKEDSLFAQVPPTLSLPQKQPLCSMYTTKMLVFSKLEVLTNVCEFLCVIT